MLVEHFVIYLSVVFCMAASVYVICCGFRLAGTLLVVGFLFQAQSFLYMHFIGHPEGTGSCWATVQSYYSCLPFAAKFSMHLGQLGPFALAAGIIVLAKRVLRNSSGS